MSEYFLLIDKESNKRDELNKVIHLSICMIFSAHATITDALKDLEKQAKKKSPPVNVEQDVEEESKTSVAVTNPLERALQFPLP